MPSVIKTKVIKPPELRKRAFRSEIRNPLRRFARKVRREWWKVIKDWEAKPEFKIETWFRAGEAGFKVFTTDKVVRFLDDGTALRWAVMSRNWVSKTQPGILSSRPGAGHVMLRGRRVMEACGLDPMPGIEARGWSKAIAKKFEKEWHKVMSKAVQSGIEKMQQKGA